MNDASLFRTDTIATLSKIMLLKLLESWRNGLTDANIKIGAADALRSRISPYVFFDVVKSESKALCDEKTFKELLKREK